MSNIKFTQLPNQAALTDTTILPTVSLGTNYTVTAANLRAYTSNVTTLSATGNITGNYILGNGSQLTGLPATYSNANVATFLANFGSNAISTTGNVTGNYIFGNGSQLTGLSATYSNANVATFLANFGSNSISTTGNITVAQANVQDLTATFSVVATGVNANDIVSYISLYNNGTMTCLGTANFQGNITSAQTLTASVITATGNIAGNYIIGNGSLLTGLPATYGNANVAAFLNAFGSNNISTSGTITAGIISTSGNITAGNTSNVGLRAGTISASGNVTLSGNLVAYAELTSSLGNTNNNFTPIYSNGIVQRITANNPFILNAPSGMAVGSSITLIITQDGTGNRIMSPNAVYRFAYGVKTLSTAANSIDVLSIFYDGTNYLCNLVKGYTV